MPNWTPPIIRRLRVQLMLNREDFGYLVGATGATVIKWESRARNPGMASRILMDQLTDEKLVPWHLKRLKQRD